MFSEFLPFTGLGRGPDRHTDPALQAAFTHHVIASAEWKNVQDPIVIPGFQTHHEQTPRDPEPFPSVPIKTAGAAAEHDGTKMQA